MPLADSPLDNFMKNSNVNPFVKSNSFIKNKAPYFIAAVVTTICILLAMGIIPGP